MPMGRGAEGEERFLSLGKPSHQQQDKLGQTGGFGGCLQERAASCIAQLVKYLSACSAADPASIPGPGSSPGEGNATPLHYSCHGQRSLVGYSSRDPKGQTRRSELVLGLQQPVCGRQDNVRPTETM